MTDNVVNFPTKEGYITGKAKCIMCRYEWVATALTGTTDLHCPACGSATGRYLNVVQLPGDHWHCGCGNDLFYVMPDLTYCSRCGLKCTFK